MMRTPKVLGVSALALGVALTGCTPDVVKNAAPPIATLKKKDKPDENVLPIVPSERVALDPAKASENYQKLLELAPDDDTKAESMRRLADLTVQIEDDKGNSGPESEKAVRNSIKLYDGLLYARPNDPHNDRVFYQLARAYQNVGEIDPAIETLEKLTTRFPKSDLAGDAHFRRAELLFARSRYEEAEREYKTVMDLKDETPFFESAQYKYGWSRYKLGNYEGAIETFSAILDRELPKDQDFFDSAKALDAVAKNKNELARDSLRVVSLSFAALGGGKAVNDYLIKKGDPRFYPLYYTALGDLFMEKRRYSDAAETYAAYITRYPLSAQAPGFQSRVIKTYAEGGFRDLVAREKERYATTYDPAAPYWKGQKPTPEVMGELRLHMEDLAKHYYAIGQGKLKPEAATKTAAAAEVAAPNDATAPEFLVAARWYKRLIEVFPADAALPQLNFMLGESLYNGGRTMEAAQEYMKTAYAYPPHPRSNDAAYAAVIAYERNAREVKPEQRATALKLTIDASLKLADTYPQHPQVARVLTRSAESYYELKDYDQAIATAARVISFPREVDYVLRRSAWSVTGDSHFAMKHYPEAEKAFTEELKLTPKNTPAFGEVTEQLAASIYKQGEAARDKGDLRTASAQFLRVGQVTPTAKIRATSEYDGAAMLIQLEDWPAAIGVLEGFRRQFPTHELLADVDKKLAVAYQKDNKPLQAAQAYSRIAARTTENAETRREAAWLTATLFDQAKSPLDATKAYEAYVLAYPRPVQRAMDSRRRLADLSKERGDEARHLYWLRELIAGDDSAGAERSDKTKVMAATAALEVGRISASRFKALRLTLPVERSLPQKKQAMELAIQDLGRAANYGYAEITTAATYELGAIYQDFAKALMDSERPRQLGALELEQYNLLLEEQAFPFEEKAIQTHEANLKRIAQGVYDQWIARSAVALATLAPAKYGKREKGEDSYATLK